MSREGVIDCFRRLGLACSPEKETVPQRMMMPTRYSAGIKMLVLFIPSGSLMWLALPFCTVYRGQLDLLALQSWDDRHAVRENCRVIVEPSGELILEVQLPKEMPSGGRVAR